MPFLIENWSKMYKIGGFVCKKSSKFEENPIIIFYTLVPLIDHPVALWYGQILRESFLVNWGKIWLKGPFTKYVDKITIT